MGLSSGDLQGDGGCDRFAVRAMWARFMPVSGFGKHWMPMR